MSALLARVLFVRAERALLAIAVAILVLVFPQESIAAKKPSLDERRDITRALPRSLRRTPAECVWIDIRVSNNSKWAIAEPHFLVGASPNDRCLKYAADGRYIARLQKGRWPIIFVGSDLPPFSSGVPKDLSPCLAT